MYINISNVDDFLEESKHMYVYDKWSDISISLQEVYFASRLFNQAGPEEQGGDLCTWKVQYDFNDNFATTGLFDPDVSTRKDTLTHAQIGWSFTKTNVKYDIREFKYNEGEVQIISAMKKLEHDMYNSYFIGMEKLLFGNGPTSNNQQKPGPTSLLWWFVPYNAASGGPNVSAPFTLPTNTLSGFYGANPPGFSNTAAIDRTTYQMWRHRVGTYQSVIANDFVNRVIEAVEKTKFKAAHPYSVWQKCNDLLQSGNDNIRNAMDTWKIDAPMIRGMPIHWIPAWSNLEFGLQRSDGLFMGVDWSTMKYSSKAGLRQVRSEPMVDKECHMARVVFLDDSGQLYCEEPRRNFSLNLASPLTVQEED